MKLTCPYCETGFNEDGNGERPGNRYNAECPRCEKSFAYEIEIEIVTTSYKADCLNGGEHDWVMPACSPEFMTQRFCPCGESEYLYEDKERQALADKYFEEIRR